jgi:hemoglobin-like flavoprotein
VKVATQAQVDTFRASLNRCLASQDFLRRFYELFVESSDEVKEKFRNTDFPKQARVLADSLYMMAVAAQLEDDAVAWSEMARLAKRHNRDDLDVRPGLYDLWLECLLKAASTHDPDFSPEVEAAWRETLAVGIRYLGSRH